MASVMMNILTKLGVTKATEAEEVKGDGEAPTWIRSVSQLKIPVLHNPAQYHLAPQQPGGGSSPADEFVPVGGPYDVLYTSLQHVVFQMEQKSATGISHFMRLGLAESVIYGLINEFSPLGKEIVRMNKEAEFTNGGWHGVGELRAGEVAKAKAKKCPKLWSKMEEARAKYAGKLYERGMRDVDILYDGGTRMMYYVEDRDAVVASGGVAYHMWPFQGEPKTMGMSIIISAGALEELFPADRNGLDGFTIVTNTDAAPYVPPSPPVHSGAMFSHLKDSYSSNAGSSNTSSVSNIAGGEHDEACDKPEDVGITRVRSKSIQAILNARKAPWNHFPSGQRASQPQPNWSRENYPFTKHTPNDHAWWQEDEKLRSELIQKWNEKTLRIVDGVFERQLSTTPPSESIPDVDYELVPTLCETFVADRNYDWYNENIAVAQTKEAEQKLPEAECDFFNNLKTAEALYRHLKCVEKQALIDSNPKNLRLKIMLRNARYNMFTSEGHLMIARDNIVQLRKQAGLKWPNALYKDLHFDFGTTDDVDCAPVPKDLRQKVILGRAAPAEPPDAPLPVEDLTKKVVLGRAGQTSRPQIVAPTDDGHQPNTKGKASIAPAAREHHRQFERQSDGSEQEPIIPVARDYQYPKTEGCEPFPKYEDPMVEIADEDDVVEEAVV